MRVRITLSYDGSAFCGFQVQKNGESVQGTLCRALKTLCRTEVPVSGCSRTDAGVHARMFVCHSDLPFSTLPRTFVKSLNALLPDEIGVSDVCKADDAFHARYSAKQKTYRYYLSLSPTRRPLLRFHALQVKESLNLDAMKAAAKQLVGTHDFKSFQAAGSKVCDTVRTVKKAEFYEVCDGLYYFEICADGFLYRMVRNVVGTLLDIGKGKPYDIETVLRAKSRDAAGRCAPPHALYLWQVDYDD